MTIMTVRGRPGQNGLALAGWLMARGQWKEKEREHTDRNRGCLDCGPPGGSQSLSDHPTASGEEGPLWPQTLLRHRLPPRPPA